MTTVDPSSPPLDMMPSLPGNPCPRKRLNPPSSASSGISLAKKPNWRTRMEALSDSELAAHSLTREDLKLSYEQLQEKLLQNAWVQTPEFVRNQITDEELSGRRLKREELLLPLEKQIELSVTRFYQEMAQTGGLDNDGMDYRVPEYGPDDSIPKGYDWASFCHGTGSKDFIVKMHCINCGLFKDHWASQCPNKDKGMINEFCINSDSDSDA